MSCPGVTAEVYPGATHLSTTACTSDAPTLCAYDPAPLTTAALAQASIGKKTLGSGRAAGSLLHLAPRCLLLLPLLAELALRQHPCRTRSSATTRRGRVPQNPPSSDYEFFRLSAVSSQSIMADDDRAYTIASSSTPQVLTISSGSGQEVAAPVIHIGSS